MATVPFVPKPRERWKPTRELFHGRLWDGSSGFRRDGTAETSAHPWLPGHANDHAMLAVIDPNEELSCWVGTICRMLRVQMRIASDGNALRRTLEGARPIGVICGDLGDSGRPVARLLKLVAAYDRSLPVMLVTRDDPETLGSIDAAAALWPLEFLQRHAGTARAATVLDFVSRACRRDGRMRMLRA